MQWILSSLTTICRFDNANVGKQPVAWKENYVEYWPKELQESKNRCTSYCGVTEKMLKMALNTTIQSINNSLSKPVAAFHMAIVETVVYGRGLNPVVMTVISPRKGVGQAGEWNQGTVLKVLDYTD